MNFLLTWIGPWIIRAVSSAAARKVALAVARKVLDAAERKLDALGHPELAKALQEVEEALFADPTPLVKAAQAALAETPTVAERA